MLNISAECEHLEEDVTEKIPLHTVKPGHRVRIRRHLAQGAIRQRLLDLGLLPTSELTIVRHAPLGDPMQLQVGEQSISLRKEEAAYVEVELLGESR